MTLLRRPLRHALLAAAVSAAALTTTSAAALTTTSAVATSPTPSESPPQPPRESYDWHITPTGTDEEFRGLAALSSRVAWVAGEEGSVLLTRNAGRRWHDVSPSEADGLALRDIEARNARHAVALSIGTGEDSRIYATTDGGQTWTETFRNPDPAAFYDCMAFTPNGRGLALSDPVDGHFQLARSNDFGLTWQVQSTTGMPAARAGEFAFAASGTCIVAGRYGHFWFVTGGIDQPRIFSSDDGGLTWTVRRTPLRGGPSAGIYSVDFAGPVGGVMVGGDYADETNGTDASAFRTASGARWRASNRPVRGYRSGVSFVPGTDGNAIAVGPTGSDVSYNAGRTWTGFDKDRYDGVQCSSLDGSCWASGTDGRVARLVRR